MYDRHEPDSSSKNHQRLGCSRTCRDPDAQEVQWAPRSSNPMQTSDIDDEVAAPAEERGMCKRIQFFTGLTYSWLKHYD